MCLELLDFLKDGIGRFFPLLFFSQGLVEVSWLGSKS